MSTTIRLAKEKGTKFYSEGRYKEAAEAFSVCIETADNNCDTDLHLYYSNRCASHLQLGNYNQAREDAEACTVLKPTWPKGYSRLAQSLLKLNKVQEAVFALEKAAELQPENNEIAVALNQARTRMTGGTLPHQSSFFSRSGAGNSSAGGLGSGTFRNAATTAKQMVSQAFAKTLSYWVSLTDETKRYIYFGFFGLLAYYFLFSGRGGGYGYGSSYSDYGGYGGYGSYGGQGLSWTTWGLIMGAAYKLPPMFPEILGPYARPFFGMSWTTFMWLLNMVSNKIPRGGGGGGFYGGRPSYGRRRYY